MKEISITISTLKIGRLLITLPIQISGSKLVFIWPPCRIAPRPSSRKDETVSTDKSFINPDALGLTDAQKARYAHAWPQLLRMMNRFGGGRDDGVALLVCLCETTCIGLNAGIKRGYISPEQAALFLDALARAKNARHRTHEEMVKYVNEGTARERERRQLPTKMPHEGVSFESCPPEVLEHMCDELDMLEELYQTNRAEWEKMPGKKLQELRKEQP